MTNSSLGCVLHHLRQAAAPSAEQRSDSELLHAFVSRRDEAAFAALVRRHAALVLRVCRHVLGHEQDAEDAFQATFLVLARKVPLILKQASLASFLHGVAYRLSLRAKRDAARRRLHESQTPVRTGSDNAADLAWREVQALVEEELARLPEKYRTPFILCHLQGLGRAEAARVLGVKEGTVWSRLTQARRRLQARLARRGVIRSAALAALTLSDESCRASVHRLVGAVLRTARSASTPPRVAALANTSWPPLSAGKLKLALAGLALLLTMAGAGGAIRQAFMPSEEEPAAQAAVEPKRPETPRARTDRQGDPLPSGAIARLGTVRWRHGVFVHALAYSPDGKRIVATGVGRDISLWDAATGKEIRSFPTRGQQPRGVAFAPDGKFFATTSGPGMLWDVATGKELRQMKLRFGGFATIAFTPDGKALATASGDGTVRLWDPATGDEKRRIDCGQGQGTLAVSPDGAVLASGGSDATIHLWETATGKEVRRLTLPKKEIASLVFSPDGKLLASGCDEDSLRLWDVATGRQVRVLGDKQGFYAPVAFSPDGKLLASGDPDGTLRLWDAASGEEKRRWRAGAGLARALAFSPDGQTLASSVLWDGGLRLWDVATGRELHPADGHHGPIGSLRFTPDQRTLISAGFDRRVLWWDVATQTPRRQFAWTTPSLRGFDLSPDGNTVAAGDQALGQVCLWDVRTRKAERLPIKDGNKNPTVVFSPDGRLVASGGSDHAIYIWDVRAGKQVRRIKGFTNPVIKLSFSPNGKLLACGWTRPGNAAGEPTLRLWDVASGEERCSFDSHASSETALAFSPDGKVLASGNDSLGREEEVTVRLWDTTTSKLVGRYTGHKESIYVIAFSPDSKLIASGGSGDKDNSIHVWEAATGRLIRRFEGDHSWVYALTFSSDGLTVASAAGDSTILLWDITGRRPDGHWHTKPLTPPELDACWTALAREDAAQAYDAVWRLVAAAEQAVPLLQKHLPPAPRPDEKRVQRLSPTWAAMSSWCVSGRMMNWPRWARPSHRHCVKRWPASRS